MTRSCKHLSHEEYARRDVPSKCDACGRWMRFDPTRTMGERVYVRRRQAPHAGRCVECPPSLLSLRLEEKSLRREGHTLRADRLLVFINRRVLDIEQPRKRGEP